MPLFLFLFLFLFSLPALAQDRRRDRDRDRDKDRNRKEPAAEKAPAPADPSAGYTAYRMVRLRNIFDPDRKPMPVEGAAAKPVAAQVTVRPPSITLTGTILSESKKLAFFTGSQSEYNKVVPVQGKVGDLTVVDISSSHVDLKRGDETLVLPVGKQLTLGAKTTVDAVTFTVPPSTAAAAVPTTTTPASPESTAPPAAASSTAPTNDPKEIMRRMMERRQKENK